MENVENKVLARIKKMLALGNDAAATEAERETALRMAYNLLAKYNLSISDVPGDTQNEAREKQEFMMSADIWARGLCGSIGKLFFCNYYFVRHGAGKDGHHFIGRQSNVVTATYMAEFVLRSIKKEATKRYKSPTSPEGRSFCVGTVNVICRRVFEMIRTAPEDSKPGTELVLVKLHDSEADANKMWLSTELNIEVTKAKGRADNSLRADAYSDGKAFGKTVSLNQQVGATVPTGRKQLK